MQSLSRFACGACGSMGDHATENCPHLPHCAPAAADDYDAAGLEVLRAQRAGGSMTNWQRNAHATVGAAHAVWTHPATGASLFVGGMSAAQDPAFLKAAAIKYIVNCIGSKNSFRQGVPTRKATAGSKICTLQFPASSLLPANEVFWATLPGCKTTPSPRSHMLRQIKAGRGGGGGGAAAGRCGRGKTAAAAVDKLCARKAGEPIDAAATSALADRVAGRFEPYLRFVDERLEAGESVLVLTRSPPSPQF